MCIASAYMAMYMAVAINIVVQQEGIKVGKLATFQSVINGELINRCDQESHSSQIRMQTFLPGLS